MLDFVIPQNNEKDFIKVAEKLGYSNLCFLYTPNDFYDKKSGYSVNVKISRGMLLDGKNLGKELNKVKGNCFVAVKAHNIREAVEHPKINLVFGVEGIGRKDFMHQRGSGLNHITAKLAAENGVAVAFSFNSLLHSNNKGRLMGRMMQNIKLCRKYKTKTIIASFAGSPYEMRSPHDLKSLFAKLGYSN